MKKSSQPKEIHSRVVSRTFRLAAAGVLVLAGAALAYIGTAPKLPWAVPTVNVGNGAVTSVVDQATHTVYVANGGDDTVSVIDGTKCNSGKTSGCSPIATLTVGPNPLFMAFESGKLLCNAAQNFRSLNLAAR
jgi:YVTN family beta-propeller protein